VQNFPATLSPAGLHGTFFDDTTILSGITLGDPKLGYITVADLHWRGVNLAVVDWPAEMLLGDERIARRPMDNLGKPKTRDDRIADFKAAVRANRQLAVALQDQGLREEGARFAYRAELLQQQVLWRQRAFGKYIFARFLDLIAGYGYKPGRSLIAYLTLVLGFAAVYLAIGVSATHGLTWNEALVVSLTAFHGRGFFANTFQPSDPQAAVAAAEAVVGLLIEISFIATFTQRFFGSN
jgi:hypothetical protein